MTHRLRFGVLGIAKIAMKKVLPAMRNTELCEVTAISSRDLERARAASREFDIAIAHESYEALLADDTIDAVYIPLPNHLHVSWSIRAFEAGKHVLCEKPTGLDAADAARLRDCVMRRAIILASRS